MAGLVIEEPEEQTEDDRDKQQIWQIEAFGVTDAAVNEIVVGLLEAADRLCVSEDQGNAVDDGLRAELAKQGKSIIMISSEMGELIGMSDRIMVMCDGKVTGFIDSQDATQESVMKLATLRQS